MNKYFKLYIYRYYLDLIMSSSIFLISFYITFIYGSFISSIISSIFLYRIGAFTHEIAHQYNNPKIKLFKFIWDITIGCLILQPSLRFKSPHLKHHTVGIFATEKDPQYPLIFKNTLLAFAIFILLPFLIPIYNFILCLIPFKNTKLNKVFYKNEFKIKEKKELLILESYYILVWLLIGLINYRLLICLYIVSIGSWFLSVLRIPLEHPLNEYKKTSDIKDQEVLSYTHTNFLYVILQPLGLRFHKAHHVHPKVPYYNLKKINKVYNES